MKRQIVLDTETTGINVKQGNRIIEIGCVELINRKLTGNNFHQYVNPERESEEGALRVHGLTTEFLSDKPKFSQIASSFLEYVKGAEIIIHNAPFDVSFLDGELERLELGIFAQYVDGVVDSLALAKEMFPGKRNSLDALCDRFDISNAHRKLHGALLDAELLADVFLAMSRGQNSFLIEEREIVSEQTEAICIVDQDYSDILVLKPNEQELTQHQIYLDDLAKSSKGNCIWQKINEKVE